MKRRKYKVALIIAFSFLFVITIAYAALSTTLNVTVNKVTISPLTWNVGFVGTSATATASGTSSTGRTCGEATITATSVTVADTTLSKPDDKCTYALTVKNAGTIAAKLSTITPTNPTGTNVTCATSSGPTMVCGNITYKLTTDSAGTTALATNTTLGIGATQPVYLVVSYNSNTVSSSSVIQNGAKFSIKYDQA